MKLYLCLVLVLLNFFSSKGEFPFFPTIYWYGLYLTSLLSFQLKACNATSATQPRIPFVQHSVTLMRQRMPWWIATAWNQPLQVICASRFLRAVRTLCTPRVGRRLFVAVPVDPISVSVGAAATISMSSVSTSKLATVRTEMAVTRLLPSPIAGRWSVQPFLPCFQLRKLCSFRLIIQHVSLHIENFFFFIYLLELAFLVC